LTARDSDVIKTYARIGLGVGILAKIAVDLVRAAEKVETQDEVDRILAGFKVPQRDNH